MIDIDEQVKVRGNREFQNSDQVQTHLHCKFWSDSGKYLVYSSVLHRKRGDQINFVYFLTWNFDHWSHSNLLWLWGIKFTLKTNILKKTVCNFAIKLLSAKYPYSNPLLYKTRFWASRENLFGCCCLEQSNSFYRTRVRSLAMPVSNWLPNSLTAV